MPAHLLRDDFALEKFGELYSVRLTAGGDEVLATRANIQRLITRLMQQIQDDDARPVCVEAFGSRDVLDIHLQLPTGRPPSRKKKL